MSDNTATVLDNTADTTAATPKVKGKPGRPVQVNSVLAQCKTLFVQRAQAGKNRSEILDAFVANANPPITRGTAQVYYHEAKNAAAEAGQNFDVKRSPSKPRVAKTTEGVKVEDSTSPAGDVVTETVAETQATETNEVEEAVIAG